MASYWNLMHLVGWYLLIVGVARGANSAGGRINLIASNEVVPSGSVVQVKFSLAKMQAVTVGALSIDFDPDFFDNVTAVSAFSAAGDANGYATVQGRHVEIHFSSSPSASIGVVRGLPVVAITVPVRPGLPAGAKAVVSANASAGAWYAPGARDPYSVTVTPGSVTIGGTLSVREVQPASGEVPAGGIIHILGGVNFSGSPVIVSQPELPQVLIGGLPAPVLSASDTQILTVVPQELSSMMTASVEFRHGLQTAQWALPVAVAAPGVFTLDSSGQGPAAVLNQDNSVNGPSNPAPRGSVLQVFATGFGRSGQNVSLTIGGAAAEITFAGPAPGAVPGVFQVNARVPAGAPTGSAIPLVLGVGSYRSQDGITAAVQ